MKPFKMFFGLAIGIILFLFLARVAFIAFIIAAVMSLVYAIFRRVKDFITYDRYGEPYMNEHPSFEGMRNRSFSEVEPLFYENNPFRQEKINKIQFIEAV